MSDAETAPSKKPDKWSIAETLDLISAYDDTLSWVQIHKASGLKFSVNQCRWKFARLKMWHTEVAASGTVTSDSVDVYTAISAVKSKIKSKIDSKIKIDKWPNRDILALISAYDESLSWKEIVERSGLKYSINQCRWKFSALKTWHTKGLSRSKLAAGTMNLYNALSVVLPNSRARVKPPISVKNISETMCRCCGQVTENLIDMDNEDILLNKNMQAMEWFLYLTNLKIEDFSTKYTKICSTCLKKLADAFEFRQQCLAVESVFQDEAKVTIEATYDDILVDISEDIPEDILKDIPEDILKDIPEDLPKDIPEDIPEDIRAITPENIPIVIDISKKKEPKLLFCEICARSVPVQSFKRHLIKHNKVVQKGTYPCKICAKVFGKQRNLDRHVQFHDKQKRYVCQVCKKSFASSSGLRWHQTTHDESLNKFLCTICDAKFPTGSYLQYHLNRHTDFKPYECKDCGIKYRTATGVNNHIKRIHENIVYECDKCQKSYATKGKLKVHILVIHEGAKLRCDVCSMEFPSKETIVRHLKGVHERGYDQSVHIILTNNEKVVRSRKMDDSFIQTDAITDSEDN